MKKNDLSSQDMELLNKLIQTTTSIETLYRKMFELELENKTDTEEFSKLLDYLNIAIDVEEKLYSDSNLNYLKCISLVDFMIENKLPDSFPDDMESIMTQNYNNRVLRRILNTLVHKIISDYESIKKSLPNEIIDLMLQLGMPNPEQIVSQSIYSSIELQKAFEKDLINGYLVFLQDLIGKRENIPFKEALIKSKYNMIFVHKQIENDLLSNKLSIQDNFYANSKFIADLTQTDLALYKMLKNSFGVKESTKQISEIIEIGDMDYSNIDTSISCMLRQCLMRSGFLLMSDEVISDINYEFHEFVEKDEYLKRHPNDHISEQLVINCFKSIKRDRTKQMVLSLGYR